MSGVSELELAVEALREGNVLRFLTKPFKRAELLEAVTEGARQSEALVAHRKRAEELRASCSSLSARNRRLEERVSLQSHSLTSFHHLAVALNQTSDVQGIACAAAESLAEALEDRGVYVQLWCADAPVVEAGLGPEMSSELHTVPVTTSDGQVGEVVVDCLDSAGNELSLGQAELVGAVSSMTAVAVHNELRRRERDEAQYATIVALARLSEKRDQETGRHLERVSEYCVLIAKRLREVGRFVDQLTDDYIRDLGRSAPLHDIGKVGIPDSILLKPGKLSAREWEVMKTHAEIGAATLEGVVMENACQDFLLMGCEIARCHHERWDGQGYPAGLVGEEIPLSARILSLADVYDALTSVRPYKAAWKHDEALNWVEEHSGVHFDPVVVAAFLSVAEQANSIRARLADRPEDFEAKPILRALRRTA